MLPDVVGSLGWTSFTVVYYDNSDLRRVAGLLKMYDYRGYTVTLRQLPAGEDYRSVSGPLSRAPACNSHFSTSHASRT